MERNNILNNTTPLYPHSGHRPPYRPLKGPRHPTQTNRPTLPMRCFKCAETCCVAVCTTDAGKKCGVCFKHVVDALADKQLLFWNFNCQPKWRVERQAKREVKMVEALRSFGKLCGAVKRHELLRSVATWRACLVRWRALMEEEKDAAERIARALRVHTRAPSSCNFSMFIALPA